MSKQTLTDRMSALEAQIGTIAGALERIAGMGNVPASPAQTAPGVPAPIPASVVAGDKITAERPHVVEIIELNPFVLGSAPTHKLEVSAAANPRIPNTRNVTGTHATRWSDGEVRLHVDERDFGGALKAHYGFAFGDSRATHNLAQSYGKAGKMPHSWGGNIALRITPANAQDTARILRQLADECERLGKVL